MRTRLAALRRVTPSSTLASVLEPWLIRRAALLRSVGREDSAGVAEKHVWVLLGCSGTATISSVTPDYLTDLWCSLICDPGHGNRGRACSASYVAQVRSTLRVALGCLEGRGVNAQNPVGRDAFAPQQ